MIKTGLHFNGKTAFFQKEKSLKVDQTQLAPHNKQSKVDTESEGSSLATASVVSSDLPNIRRGEHEGGEGEEYKG